MKKFFLLISAFLALVFFACDDFSNLQIPESVSVKTAARFEIPMGNGAISIRKKASIEEIQKILDDNIEKNATSEQLQPTVYEYNPVDSNGKLSESATMQYIINYPIKTIYLNSLQTANGETLDTASLENIKIPDTSFSINDFIDKINDAMAKTMNFENSFSIPELGTDLSVDDAIQQIRILHPDFPSPEFNFRIVEPTFETMKFESGKVKISITSPSTTSANFELNVTVTIVDATDHSKQIAPSANGTVIGPDVTTVLTIDLAGASVVKNMDVLISGSISGGTLGNFDTYSVKMKASEVSGEELRLAEITGLTISNEKLESDYNAGTIDISENFEVTLDKSFVSATIEEGSMQFFCKYPEVADGESEKLGGINIVESEFVLSGGMSRNDSSLSGFVDKGGAGYIVNKELDLEGVVIKKNYDKNGDSKLDTCAVSTSGSYIKPELKDAYIVFPKTGEELTLNLGGVCSIKKIGEMTFSLGELDNFSDTVSTGLSFSTLLGDVMGGENKDLIKDIEFQGVEGYLFLTQPTDDTDLKGLEIEGTVKVNYEIDGVAQTPDYIVEDKNNPGQKATISMKTTKTLKDVLVDGKMVTEEDNIQSTISALAGKSKLVTTDILFKHEGDDCSDESHFHSFKIKDGKMDELLNKRPDNLSITYDMGLTTPEGDNTITLTDLENLTSDASLSVSLVLVVPLHVNLVDYCDIPSSASVTDGVITIEDVQSLSKKDDSDPDKDLLDRDSAKDTDFKKYATSLTKATFRYNVTNELIKNLTEYTTTESGETITHPVGEDLDVKLTLYTVDLNGNPTEILDGGEKELVVADGVQEAVLSNEEILKILSKEGWPFIPKVRAEITVPKDGSGNNMVQYIPRNGQFALNGTLNLVFDESIPVEVWSK